MKRSYLQASSSILFTAFVLLLTIGVFNPTAVFAADEHQYILIPDENVLTSCSTITPIPKSDNDPSVLGIESQNEDTGAVEIYCLLSISTNTLRFAQSGPGAQNNIYVSKNNLKVGAKKTTAEVATGGDGSTIGINGANIAATFLSEGSEEGNDTISNPVDQPNLDVTTEDIQIGRLCEERYGSNSQDYEDCVDNGGPPSIDTDGSSDYSGVTGDPTSDDSNNDNQSCEDNGGPIGFIACAVINILDWTFQLIDSVIVSQLTIDPARYNNEELLTSAAIIRNIAYIVLIPILLVMVIGTALNFSFFDAYTVKRALPRMLVAIIFITLSWPILVFMIEITETIAAGLNGIITSPFRTDGELSLNDIFGPDFLGGLSILAIPGLIYLLVVFGGTLAGVALIGFLILLARQIFIVGLMLIAPLAILAWIFPGNDKLWKGWWSAFSKLLIMYPLIIGLLALGKAFAHIIYPGSSEVGNLASENIITPVSAFIVYFLPYAFIPFAFRTAGGVFGQLTGAINDRGKGYFDKQRQKRAKTNTDVLAGASENKALKAAGLNRIGRRLGGGATLGFGNRGKSRMTQRFDMVSGKNAQENEKLKNLMLHDDEAGAIMAIGGQSEIEARSARDKLSKMHADDKVRKAAEAAGVTEQQYRASNAQDVAKIEKEQKERFQRAFSAAQAVGFSRSNQRAAIQLSGQNKARAILPGQEGLDMLREASDSLYRGDKTAIAQGRGEAAYFMRSGGRFDLGSSSLETIDGGIQKAGLYQLANGETSALKAWGQSVIDSGSATDIERHLAELRSMQPNTLGANRDEVNRQIQVIEQLKSSSPFMQTTLDQPSGRIDPNTGRQKKIIERYDAARGLADPSYDAKFTATEKRVGGRAREETRGDAARTDARAYERPDPNRME